MKEFLKTNTVTYNLMSFTGFKSILIFAMLLDGPKSYKDIQDYMKNHEYLHETISVDTLRIYFNSLKEIGCNVVKERIDGVTKYSIDRHPFELKFTNEQIKSIIQIYKAISKSIEVTDLISLQQFFEKIAIYITDEKLKKTLKKISPLNNINPKLVQELMEYAQNNTEITMFYKSGNSGNKDITIIIDKLHINNSKLYISGFNSEHNTYSSFLVEKILSIKNVNLNAKTLDIPEITVGYQYLKDEKEDFELLSCEKIVESDDKKLIIEITSLNKFEIMQRVMSHSTRCKVLYPEDFKAYTIANLKKMKEGYLEQ